MLRAKSRLPALLSLALLSAQILLPWTVPHFVTQDGPSHVSSALTGLHVLLHRHSLQRTLYHFRPGIVPNWTSTVLLAAIAPVVGPANAERVMVDLCVFLGVFSFHYAACSLAGRRLGLTPLPNFLFNTWFLWLGFYNFSLGMALCPLAIGYFIRHRPAFTLKHAVILSAATILVFFTHLIPAAVVVLAVLAIALWTRPGLRPTALAVGAMLPTIALILAYAAGKPALEWKPGIAEALIAFPPYMFATAAGRLGGQEVLVPGVLLCIAVALFGLGRTGWRSEKGALAAAALACFLLYLIVPNEGLGGSESKIRFAWVVFVLGGLIAASALRPRLETALAIYIAVLLGGNLFVTWQSLRLTSRAVEDYIAATDRIPQGAVFVRIHFPTPLASQRYGLASMGRDPFFHLDAYSASRRGSIDLSDYEALNPIFPLAVRPRIATAAQQTHLWSLEGPGDGVSSSLAFLRANLAVPFEYLILVADPGSDPPGLANLTAQLALTMRPFATSPGQFVQIYQRAP
jgi:hypothetical protein